MAGGKETSEARWSIRSNSTGKDCLPPPSPFAPSSQACSSQVLQDNRPSALLPGAAVSGIFPGLVSFRDRGILPGFGRWKR